MKVISSVILAYSSIAPVVDAAAKVNGRFCAHSIYSNAGVQCTGRAKGSKPVQWPSSQMNDAFAIGSWTSGGAQQCAGAKRKREPESLDDPSAAPELSSAPHQGFVLKARSPNELNPHANAAPGVYTAKATIKDGTSFSHLAMILGHGHRDQTVGWHALCRHASLRIRHRLEQRGFLQLRVLLRIDSSPISTPASRLALVDHLVSRPTPTISTSQNAQRLFHPHELFLPFSARQPPETASSGSESLCR